MQKRMANSGMIKLRSRSHQWTTVGPSQCLSDWTDLLLKYEQSRSVTAQIQHHYQIEGYSPGRERSSVYQTEEPFSSSGSLIVEPPGRLTGKEVKECRTISHPKKYGTYLETRNQGRGKEGHSWRGT